MKGEKNRRDVVQHTAAIFYFIAIQNPEPDVISAFYS